MTRFGKRLRHLRRAKGLSLDGLASRTGISRAYLWKLESRPEVNPSLDRLQSLADALGTTAGNLIPSKESDRGMDSPIPESLQQCQEIYGLSDDDTDDLARILFRGGHSTKMCDWFQLYCELKRKTQLSIQDDTQ
jgi:transcriptional regulator with XRE-family HTH domain